MTKILTHHITAAAPGPHLLVLGAIHGNETCGPAAMKDILADFAGGALSLLKGQVTFIPVCNPAAYAENARFIDKNLNRVFQPSAQPDCYEAELANELTPYVEAADVVLDLHSVTSTNAPFAFLDYEEPPFTAFTEALGVGNIICGWPQVQAAPDSLNESDTISYARRMGKIGAVVECGVHGTPEADAVARRVILNALVYLGALPGTAAVQGDTAIIRTRVTHMVLRKQEGAFTRPWCHLDRLHKGDIIAHYADGSVEVAPANGRLIMPLSDAGIGHEWFYLGEDA